MTCPAFWYVAYGALDAFSECALIIQGILPKIFTASRPVQLHKIDSIRHQKAGQPLPRS